MQDLTKMLVIVVTCLVIINPWPLIYSASTWKNSVNLSVYSYSLLKSCYLTTLRV